MLLLLSLKPLKLGGSLTAPPGSVDETSAVNTERQHLTEPAVQHFAGEWQQSPTSQHFLHRWSRCRASMN